MLPLFFVPSLAGCLQVYHWLLLNDLNNLKIFKKSNKHQFIRNLKSDAVFVHVYLLLSRRSFRI